MKKIFYLMAFMVLFVCGQAGLAQAEPLLEDGWYFIQTPDGRYLGLGDHLGNKSVQIVLQDPDAKPLWMFHLKYVNEESGEITLQSISSSFCPTESDIAGEGGNLVIGHANLHPENEPGSIWKLNAQGGWYVLYAASSTSDEKQLLRYYGDNVVTSSEYNVGKNYFWKFIKTEPAD